MKGEIFTENHTATLEEALERLGAITWICQGISMRPLIVSGRDYVSIQRAKGELNPMDVALYKRGGRYILHRVIGVEDGYYCILGDNCLRVERVPREDVIGVMCGLVRDGKTITLDSAFYRAYVFFYARPWRLRLAGRHAASAIKRVAKRILPEGTYQALKRATGRR